MAYSAPYMITTSCSDDFIFEDPGASLVFAYMKNKTLGQLMLSARL